MIFPLGIIQAQELIQAPAAIQITSVVSDGKYTLSEITAIARRNGFNVVIFTDRDLMRWQYGFWPLRNIFKKTVEDNSISKYGVSRYLREMSDLENKNRDMVLIPGVEAAPFYYWEGRPFTGNFKIKNWHKHILVFGLDKKKDIERLPSISNVDSLAEPFGYCDFFRFWPFLFLFAGAAFFRKRKFGYSDLKGNPLGEYSPGWRILGGCCFFLGALFLFNGAPFRGVKYDQYHGDQGTIPYQNLIDYVNLKGGLTFWSHPEAKNFQEINGVKIETLGYEDDLLSTDGYTGFATFYEGYDKVGLPGGIWDGALMQYCRRLRKKPVWAIGGLSFDQGKDLGQNMNDLRTVCLVPELNKVEILRALKDGMMYVVRGSQSSAFILDKFTVEDASRGIKKTMGQLLETGQDPDIVIKGHLLNGQTGTFKIRLIRDGKVIKVFETVSPFDIVYRDEDSAKIGGVSYYRIEAQTEGVLAVTNPVFLKQK